MGKWLLFRSLRIWLSCTLGVFGASDVLAGIITPETYFTGKQLVAYLLAHEGDTESLVQATKAGVDLNRPGKEDMTMLGLAVLNADRPAIISLMRAGADANQVIPGAGSPAILAISKHFNPPRTEAVEALLEAGYDPNQWIGHGTPYLFYFVDYNHWSGLKLALKRGGNINVRRKNCESLLTYLIDCGDYAQAREIIAMGADVAARGNRGESALESIELKIEQVDPSIAKVWNEVLAMRELILSKLPNPEDRHTAFTEAAERKIRKNSSK